MTRRHLRQQLTRLAAYYTLPTRTTQQRRLVISTAYHDRNVTIRQAEQLAQFISQQSNEPLGAPPAHSARKEHHE